jgi:hypothetical protein
VGEGQESEPELRQTAWVESDHPEELASFLAGGQSHSSEAIRVVPVAPGHAELHVDLHTPGLVDLADVYYPG